MLLNQPNWEPGGPLFVGMKFMHSLHQLKHHEMPAIEWGEETHDCRQERSK